MVQSVRGGAGSRATPVISGEQSPHRGNRYGRSEAARVAIMEAADNLLVEVGFTKLTIEGIAARAGVSKPTIYRWWKSKTEILLDAFLQDVLEELAIPDTGNLERDLQVQMDRLVHFFGEADAGAVFRALLAEAQHDPALLSLLREGFLAPQRVRDRLPFERAANRGEISADENIDLLVERLTAPVYYRFLMRTEPVTSEHADMLVRSLIAQVVR